MRTIVVTGSASGVGAATRDRLVGEGHRVIGVDLHDAEIVADLGTPEGRQNVIAEVRARSGGAIEGLVTFAGVGGLPGRALRGAPRRPRQGRPDERGGDLRVHGHSALT